MCEVMKLFIDIYDDSMAPQQNGTIRQEWEHKRSCQLEQFTIKYVTEFCKERSDDAEKYLLGGLEVKHCDRPIKKLYKLTDRNGSESLPSSRRSQDGTGIDVAGMASKDNEDSPKGSKPSPRAIPSLSNLALFILSGIVILFGMRKLRATLV